MFFIIVKIPVILYMVINFTKSPIDVFAVTMNGNGEYAFTIVNDHLEAVCVRQFTSAAQLETSGN